MHDVLPLRPAPDAPSGEAAGRTLGRVRGLVYAVRDKRLVDGIDLDVDRASRTIVLGPNGAGKSLFLRLLHGLIPASSGSIEWDGRPIGPAVMQEQAMVFQRPVLLRRSVAANIAFVLRQRRLNADGEVERLLEEVGLLDRGGQAARQLSGGEQQRLTLARALATRPRVLFLDEPTASLDPAATAAIEDIVQRSHERGTKIVMVTHNVGQARRLADDVVFLHHGRIAEHAPAATFFSNPKSRAAADYLDDRLVL